MGTLLTSPARTRSPRRGLTLVELGVIMVVVALLAAIAIPTFAAVVERASKDAPAIELEQALSNALAIARFNDRLVPTAADVQIALDESYTAAAGVSAQLVDSWQVCAPGDPGYPGCPLDPTRTGLAVYERDGDVVGVALVGVQCVMGRVVDGQVLAWVSDNTCSSGAALAGAGELSEGVGQESARVNWGLTDQPIYWQNGFEGHLDGTQLTATSQVNANSIQAAHRTLGAQPTASYGDLITFSNARAHSGNSSLYIKGDADRFKNFIVNLSCGSQALGATCSAAVPRPENLYVSMYIFLEGTQGTGSARFTALTSGAYSSPQYQHLQSLYATDNRTAFRSLYNAGFLTAGTASWVTGQWMRVDYDWSRSGTARMRTFWGDTLDSYNPADAKSDSGPLPTATGFPAGLLYFGALSYNPSMSYYLDDVKVSTTPLYVPESTNRTNNTGNFYPSAPAAISVTDAGAFGNGNSGSNEQPGDSTTHRLGISDDSRFVVFSSTASNLVAGDTNGVRDIFVRDRTTNTTERVSTSSTGAQATGYSDNPTMTGDGRYVVFESADALVPGDTNNSRDVFVKDRVTGATERVSTSSTGTQGNNNASRPAIARSGRYVAFASSASNLVDNDTNTLEDIFRKDLTTGELVRISVNSSGTQGNSTSDQSHISDDGNVVAFQSTATNLAAGDTDAFYDIYVRDVSAGTTVRASVSSAGTGGDAVSGTPALSGDGRFVVFNSLATNLVGNDTNNVRDVFVHDLAAATTERVSVDANGTQGTTDSGLNSSSYLSADGRYVLFASGATNLAGGNGSFADVLVKDRTTGALTRMLSRTNSAPDGNELYPVLSKDRTLVVLSSNASSLTSTPPTGATRQVYTVRTAPWVTNW